MGKKKRRKRKKKNYKNRKLKRFAKNLFMWIGICVAVYFLITLFTNIRISGIPSIEVDTLEKNCNEQYSEYASIGEKTWGINIILIKKERIENELELNNFYNMHTGARDKIRKFPLYAFAISRRLPDGIGMPAIIICDKRGLTSQSKDMLR